MTTQDILNEVREIMLKDEDPRLQILGLFTPEAKNGEIYDGIKSVYSSGVSFKHLSECNKLTPVVCEAYITTLSMRSPAMICEAVIAAALEWCAMPQAREDSVKSLMARIIPMADKIIEEDADWMY